MSEEPRADEDQMDQEPAEPARQWVAIPVERYDIGVGLVARLLIDAEDTISEYRRTKELPPIALVIRFRALLARALEQLRDEEQP